MGSIEGAVGDLEAALGVDPEKDAMLTDQMEQLAAVARQLAVDAITEAVAQGGDPTGIGDAEQSMANGDTFLAEGKFKDAVAKYKDALAKAESAIP